MIKTGVRRKLQIRCVGLSLSEVNENDKREYDPYWQRSRFIFELEPDKGGSLTVGGCKGWEVKGSSL
jgi:hypothetical protein